MQKASHLVCALALGFTGATIARPADAQAFGNQGDMAFSAERLMGIYFYDEPTGGPGPQPPSGSTHIGLGIAPIGASRSPYLLPRLGFDYFVIDSLSVGGSLGFGDFDPEGGDATSGAMIAPRVGYALEFSKVFGFWPRGGFTYRNFGNGGGGEEFALTLEAMFYAAPVEHFAITFGPLMDLGIAGTGGEAKNFALFSAGILGWI